MWSLAEPDVADGATVGAPNNFAFGMCFDRPILTAARPADAGARMIEQPRNDGSADSRNQWPEEEHGRYEPIDAASRRRLLRSGSPRRVRPGGEASHDGQAFLFNQTRETELRVVVRRPDDVRQEGGPLEEGYTFDTQWTDRKLQCYVASDGYFEVIRADGSVLVHHEFADRPLCEREEITLEADAELVWAE